MSYKLALVFLVGLVAFAGAVPVDNPEQDAELDAVVADTEKEVPLNQESVPEEKSEDENQESENDEDEDESDSEEEEEPENELDEAKRNGSGRQRPRYCPKNRYSAYCRTLSLHYRRVCSTVQCFSFGKRNRGTWGRICKSVRRRVRIRTCRSYSLRLRRCSRIHSSCRRHNCINLRRNQRLYNFCRSNCRRCPVSPRG